jgi:hypothetical protein
MTPEEYRKITGREPDEDELEALAWLTKLSAETGAGIEVGDVRDIVENQNKEGGWIPRSDADSEAQKSKYVQQYALRGASGGDRSKGGYNTDLIDNPDRVWTRGQEGSEATDGTPGQDFEAWKAPDALDGLPAGIEARIKAMFREFLGRDATPEEIRDLMRSEEVWEDSPGGGSNEGDDTIPGESVFTGQYRQGWEERLLRHLGNSEEYRLGSGGETTLSDRIKALYKKYGREAPSDSDINAHKNNPRGLVGIEHELALNPGEGYRQANPAQAFIQAVDGTDAVTASDAAWNTDAPTMGDLFNPRPTPVPDPVETDDNNSLNTSSTAQPIAAAPKTPYSARPMAQTYPVNTGTRAASTTPPGYPSGMPASPVYPGTLGQVMSNQRSTSSVSGGDPSSWENYGGYYGKAGQDFQNGPQGWGYNPAPWANTDQLLRGQFGRPGLTRTSTNALTGDATPDFGGGDSDDRARRAYEFGRRENSRNQSNADLGNQDFRSQMDRWIQSYNRWNQQGVDPWSSPVNSRQGMTGTRASGNTGDS